MDSLIALFIVLGLIKALNKAAQKKAVQKKAANTLPQSAFDKPVKKQSAGPVQQPVSVPVPVAVPAAPEEGKLYAASLMPDSTEGMDLCDPSLEHERETVTDLSSVYAHEIGAEHRLDLTPNGLWQGVVMSEILTRPADRNRRKGASWRN